jgi:predicted RNase H-like nuclease (RuvC/YqgF family)
MESATNEALPSRGEGREGFFEEHIKWLSGQIDAKDEQIAGLTKALEDTRKTLEHDLQVKNRALAACQSELGRLQVQLAVAKREWGS